MSWPVGERNDPHPALAQFSERLKALDCGEMKYESLVNELADALRVDGHEVNDSEVLFVARNCVEAWPMGMVVPESILAQIPAGKLHDYKQLELAPNVVESEFMGTADVGADFGSEELARKQGFASDVRMDLFADHPTIGDFAAGHLVKWMISNGIPLGPARLGVATQYAYFIAESVPESAPSDWLVGHCVCVRETERVVASFGLSEDLLLLSWYLQQLDRGLDLAHYLELREHLR